MAFYAVRLLADLGNTPAGTLKVVEETSQLVRGGRGGDKPVIELLHAEPMTKAEARALAFPEDEPEKPKARKRTPAAKTASDEADALAALQASGDEF